MTYELRAVPKPKRRRKSRSRPSLRKTRLKAVNRKRKGRAFGAACVDEVKLSWIQTLPCAVCIALGVEQREPTEVEHFKLRSHGGADQTDTYPTCGVHRRMRHEQMGSRAFTRMLLARGFDEAKLCKKLATLYEAERWPCP